ncbi:hypothetical protein RCL1_008296 [Eukaryota sp. TZLM3-RCL]
MPQRISQPRAFLDKDNLRQLRSASPPLFNTLFSKVFLRPCSQFLANLMPSRLSGNVVFLVFAMSSIFLSVAASLLYYTTSDPSPTQSFFFIIITFVSCLFSSFSFFTSTSHAVKIRRITPIIYVSQSILQSPLICLISISTSGALDAFPKYPRQALYHVLSVAFFQYVFTLRRFLTVDDEVTRVIFGNAADLSFLLGVVVVFSRLSFVKSNMFILHYAFPSILTLMTIYHVIRAINDGKQSPQASILSSIYRCLYFLSPFITMSTIILCWTFLDSESTSHPLLFSCIATFFASLMTSKLEIHRQSGLPFYAGQPILALLLWGLASTLTDKLFNFHLIFNQHILLIVVFFISLGVLLQYSVSILAEFASSLQQSVLELNYQSRHMG